MRRKVPLHISFPPSPACSCEICRGYCQRPGWWSVHQASQALLDGLANRMMLEFAPDFSFAVLSPAFKGCEGSFALQEYSENGCTFLVNQACQLHGSDVQPLECCFSHHDRQGAGILCHRALERDWHTPKGQALVTQWVKWVQQIHVRDDFLARIEK